MFLPSLALSELIERLVMTDATTDFKSPFEGLLHTPSWFIPIQDFIYTPTRWLEVNIKRPEDQCVYMFASIVALVCCFLLKAHPGSAFSRKLFSTSIGVFIHYYVFGLSGLASIGNNLVSYAIIRLAPRSYQHVCIFIVSGLGLAFAQIHK